MTTDDTLFQMNLKLTNPTCRLCPRKQLLCISCMFSSLLSPALVCLFPPLVVFCLGIGNLMNDCLLVLLLMFPVCSHCTLCSYLDSFPTSSLFAFSEASCLQASTFTASVNPVLLYVVDCHQIAQFCSEQWADSGCICESVSLSRSLVYGAILYLSVLSPF